MKKLILALAMVSAPVMAVPYEDDAHIGTNRDHGVAAAKLVKLLGYRCDSITAIRKALWGGGFVLVCNNYRYEYLIKDVGGRWTVTVK